jgi:cell division protein FtsZ
MSLKLDIPQHDLLKPKIIIFGVGGAGGNAINNMIRSNLEGVEFVAANTDAQALSNSLAPNIIQLGLATTKGLGAGSFPDRGRVAAEENIKEIENFLEGCHMVFIAAGMGGGTGTGAAPVIAKLARERDILTVGVVTKPFHFEGKYRMDIANNGIEELKKFVDTLIIIPNQNLFRIANEQTTFESAFKMADDVLHAGVRGVTDLITMPGLVNLDFADIRTIMTKMGKAMMGTGEAEGQDRAVLACEAAIANPLLDDISIKGAKGVLVNMTGGPDMTLFEAELAVNTIKKQVDSNANIIFGSAFNDNMKGKIRISVVATGIDIEDNVKNENNDYNRSNNDEKNTLHEPLKNNRNFFDAGAIIKTKKEEIIEEINSSDFKPAKTYLKDPNPLYQDYEKADSVEEFEQFNFSNKDQNKNLFNKNFLPKQEETKKAKFIEDTNKDLEIKKDTKTNNDQHKNKKDSSGGFNLFGFMNNALGKKNNEKPAKSILKNKSIEEHEAEIEEDAKNKFFIQNNDDDLFNDKLSRSQNIDNLFLSDEEDKKTNFSKKNNLTIFEDKDLKKNQDRNLEIEEDDDIINVPAFFRKKV